MSRSQPSPEELLVVFESISEGICVTTPDFRILYFNSAFTELTGYRADEIAGRSIGMFVPPGHEDDLRRFASQMARDGAVQMEVEVLRNDGTRRPIMVRGRPMVSDGQPAFVHLVMDISDRKRAEEEVRATSERLQLMVAQSPNAIITWNDEFEVIEWNLAAESIFGWTKQEAVGRHAEFIVPESARSQVDKVWGELMQRRGGSRSNNDNLRKDGRRIRCKWYNAPLVNEQGEVLGVLSLVEDVTEKIQLQEEREILTMALEQSDDAIIMTDRQGTIQYANSAFELLTGWNPREVVGQNPRLLKSGEQDEAFYTEMWDSILAGQTWRGDLVNRRKDGSLYTENMTITAVFDGGGNISNFVAAKRDVTRRRHIEEQLRQGQKMEAIGRLAGGVAHDFNNMLNVILGYVDLIRSQLAEADGVVPETVAEVGEELTEIERAAQNSAELTRQLLAFSRKQVIEPQIVDLNELIAELMKTLGRMVGEEIALDFQPQKDLWNILIDPVQINQILANLAANARDAMPRGGTFSITTANRILDEAYCRELVGPQPGDHVVLTLSDDGVGINPESRKHIFEPFYTTKIEGKGTGLGLATVAGIVDQNQGHIELISTPGSGTTFRIILPRCRDDRTEAVEVSDPGYVEVSGTVLVVEDDPKVRELTRSMLEKIGYGVVLAATPAEALALFAEVGDSVDVLLTDVVMPGMNGNELYENLEAAHPGLRVLFVSGYADNIVSRRGVLKQGVNFLPKPFRLNELAEAVHRALVAPPLSCDRRGSEA